MITVTPIYAGLIAILFLALSFRVSNGRKEFKVSYGDGGEKGLIKRIRVQANCAEYAPIALILLLLAELQNLPGWALHLAGAALLLGRILHAYGLGSTPQVTIARAVGMMLTVAMIAVLAVTNIVLGFA